jgi:ATP/maltotriose-dependent transcriptional regulator MalT
VARARLRAASGETGTAARELHELARRFAELGADAVALVNWQSELAPLEARLGNRVEALALAENGVEATRRWGGARALAKALTANAELHDARDALYLFEEALSLLVPLRAPLEQARALRGEGEALLARGDAEAARRSLTRGLELATRCDARPLAAHLHDRLVAAGGRPRRPATGGASALTAAELRVAELAAEGRSNREISGELYLAMRTVEFHLSNAYRKLGIASRSQLREALRRPQSFP